MALEPLSSSNDLTNIIVYDMISATHELTCLGDSLVDATFFVDNKNSYIYNDTTMKPQQVQQDVLLNGSSNNHNKKRQRKERVRKSKKSSETKRIIHIFVERNRRKLMNEHLSVLKSLMPDSHVQRGDQASIVGGATEYVKELEQLLQSLEVQKLRSLQGLMRDLDHKNKDNSPTLTTSNSLTSFSHYFRVGCPQIQDTSTNWSQGPSKHFTTKSKGTVAEIEATLIETHANLRILISKRRPKQLSKMVCAFQALCLTILYINVTALDPLFLCSTSVKLEEGCKLTSVEEIAGAVHHMLKSIIDEELEEPDITI